MNKGELCFTSWPLDVFLHQRLSHGSVHSSCFNLGVVPPVCPVHSPNEAMGKLYLSLLLPQLNLYFHSRDSLQDPLTLSGGRLQ